MYPCKQAEGLNSRDRDGIGAFDRKGAGFADTDEVTVSTCFLMSVLSWSLRGRGRQEENVRSSARLLTEKAQTTNKQTNKLTNNEQTNKHQKTTKETTKLND